jgi:hypothetical protein
MKKIPCKYWAEMLYTRSQHYRRHKTDPLPSYAGSRIFFLKSEIVTYVRQSDHAITLRNYQGIDEGQDRRGTIHC